MCVPYRIVGDTSSLTNQNNPKALRVELGGHRRGWQGMPLLETPCPFILASLPPRPPNFFFFFNFPLIASPYQWGPPIKTDQPYYWSSGLENRVAPSQQLVFKSLPSSIKARMAQKANPTSLDLPIPTHVGRRGQGGVKSLTFCYISKRSTVGKSL